MTEPADLSALELRAAYASGELSPVEVVDRLAERIARTERLNAFTTLTVEAARVEARSAERACREGTARPLEGVPWVVKDMFDTAGVRTTYGSPMFARHVPAADAAAVARGRAAGAILLGKTSTHEFAWGITSVNPHFGSPRNPWAPGRISGGSSGGNGVALAAGAAPLALASDTGGSIRVPSAFCGVVGLKPTFGRISAAGGFPLARSLDHPGVMARTPADAALLLSVLAGADPDDPVTEDVPLGDLEGELHGGLAGLTVAVCPSLHLQPLAPDVLRVFDEAVRTVESLGARLVEVELPEAPLIYPVFVTTQRAEALHTHRRAGLFPERRDEYGDDVRGRLEAATEVTIADYLAAADDRRRVRAGFARLFERADVLLTPVSAGPPPPFGEDVATVHLGRPIEFRELVMSYTVPQDVAGLPVCAVRAGFDDLGLPVGVQFSAAPWREARALRAAAAFFGATPALQARRPSV